MILCIITIKWRLDSRNLILKDEELNCKEAELTLKNQQISELEKSKNEILIENAKINAKAQQLEAFEQKYNSLHDAFHELAKKNTVLEEQYRQEQEKYQEKVALLEKAEQKLSDTFKAISAEALSKNNESFLSLARVAFEKLQEQNKSEITSGQKSVADLILPIKTALEGVDTKLKALEIARIEAYTDIKSQAKNVLMAADNLRSETNRLTAALRSPNTRGRWGEIQLRRIAELTGMTKHCDFKEQVYKDGEDGKMQPDMVIYMPGNKQVVVDAKTPISAFLESLDAKSEEERIVCLQKHAKSVRTQVIKLSSKKYWEAYQPGPEFVVLYLPGEAFLTSALEYDPELIEYGLKQRVIIATATTLFAILHSIFLSWRQDSLSETAREIVKMGQELYKRMADMSSHFADLGKSLNASVNKYNATIASYESRVLPSIKRFNGLEVHGKEIPELPAVQEQAREPRRA